MTERTDGFFTQKELARIKEYSPEKLRIIEQYRAVAGKYVELWTELDQRTDYSEWRKDGIGSCHVSPHLFETYLDGEVVQEIENLWEAVRRDDPDGYHHACAYHREGQGCMLGDLKSPRCLVHADYSHVQEIKEKFGIILPDFVTPLRRIQIGGMDLANSNYDLHPEKNDEFVEQILEETQTLIDYVKEFPVLHPNTPPLRKAPIRLRGKSFRVRKLYYEAKKQKINP